MLEFYNFSNKEEFIRDLKLAIDSNDNNSLELIISKTSKHLKEGIGLDDLKVIFFDKYDVKQLYNLLDCLYSETEFKYFCIFLKIHITRKRI